VVPVGPEINRVDAGRVHRFGAFTRATDPSPSARSPRNRAKSTSGLTTWCWPSTVGRTLTSVRTVRRTARSTFGRPHAIGLSPRQIVVCSQWHCPTITASTKPTNATPRQPRASCVLALCISAFAGVSGGGAARKGWPHRGHAVAIGETPTPHAAHGTSCIGCMTCREAHRVHYATIGGAP
jgi:hypothetical protein